MYMHNIIVFMLLTIFAAASINNRGKERVIGYSIMDSYEYDDVSEVKEFAQENNDRENDDARSKIIENDPLVTNFNGDKCSTGYAKDILLAVISRICVKGGGGAGFSRLVSRGLPDTDRVHYYVALAPVAGCLIRMMDPKLSDEHLSKVSNFIVNEPLFRLDGLQFMLEKDNKKHFSFYEFPDDVSLEELRALETVVERLRLARDTILRSRSPGSSGAQSDLLCTICYARPADTAFVPCGHHSCRACIMQHLLNSKQCFFCKADIDTMREIEPVTS